MKIILLGYNGLIGSHIMYELVKHQKLKKNFDLVCVGRNTSNQPVKNKKIKYIKWNFLKFTKSNLYFLDKENIIINCVGKNYSDKENLENINIIFIKNLISYIKKNSIVVRFIHLGSVSVYGAEKKYFTRIKNITENSKISPDDLYSKSKFESEKIIKNNAKINKNNTYTILRIANVFSKLKNPNSFILINFLLNRGIWFNCSNQTNYHFIHAKDVALAVLLTILKIRKSRNKTYIVSDDINQIQLHEIYKKRKILGLLKIPISLKLLNLTMRYISLPRIILNLFLTISSQITYNSSKIKNELNFRPKYSLKNK